MKNKKIKPKNGTVEDISKIMKNQGKSCIYSDVDGSYTGTAKDYIKPVQDADDL